MPNEDKIIAPKLTTKSCRGNGSNWVDYRDRVLWRLESQSIDVHAEYDSPPSTYTALGKIGGL